MIKPHPHMSYAAVFPLPTHIAPAEDGGSHRDKRGEDREVNVKGVYEEKFSSRQHGTVVVHLEGQPETCCEICGRAKDIDLGGKLSVSHKGQYDRGKKGHHQQNKQHHLFAPTCISLHVIPASKACRESFRMKGSRQA